MDISKVIKEKDALFREMRFSEGEKFVLEKIEEAKEEGDIGAIITLSNELIGFYRTSSRYQDLMNISDDVILLMKNHDFEGTVPYATTLLNTATGYREAGKIDIALDLYKEVWETYKQTIPKTDMRLAALFNNMSQAYMMKKDYEKSYSFLEKALFVTEQNENVEIKKATSKTNMGHTLMAMNKVEEAIKYIGEALEIFEAPGKKRDFHYSAALAAMGEGVFLLKDYEKALEYYKKALTEIEYFMGRNKYYAITCKNIAKVYEQMNDQEEKEKHRAIADEILREIR